MVGNRADAVPESCVPEKYTGTTKQPSRILYHEHDVHDRHSPLVKFMQA